MSMIETRQSLRSGTARSYRPLLSWLALWRQRQALAHMEDAQLEDLGLTRSEAETEAARPFWDAPESWKR